MKPIAPPLIYRLKIAGEAGDGIMSAGDTLMRAVARLGYNASIIRSFPSNIRGGYAHTVTSISDTCIISPTGESNLLFFLSTDSLLTDIDYIAHAAITLVESEAFSKLPPDILKQMLPRLGKTLFVVPVLQYAREVTGSCTIRSTVALGVIGELLGISPDLLQTALAERFSEKGNEIVELNYIALQSGYLWAEQHLHGAAPTLQLQELSKTNSPGRIILDGNQAIALGALACGCTFFASYPITPATPIGELLAELLPLRGGFAYQAEDEIAALGAVIGASFSGAKALTATSGPGLSLMQEFIGYSSMVELPVVIVDVQRVGPSTGMPTKHSQDDLLAAIFGGHGEGPRIVVAPSTVEDCFYTTISAFSLAEQYQCPVIILSDSTLGLTKSVISQPATEQLTIINRDVLHTLPAGNEPFLRYKVSATGSNPIPVPGISPVSYRATGIEHDEDSQPVHAKAVRAAQVERRFKKLHPIENAMSNAVTWDVVDTDARALVDICLCSWGLTASITREAVAQLRQQGVSVAALYLRLLYPLCTTALTAWGKLGKRHLVIEANFTGQFCSLVKMAIPLRPESLTLAHGEPFSPREIIAGVLKLLSDRADTHD